MEMIVYKIDIKDSEIQELLIDWGFQVQSVRKTFYEIFPDEIKLIRETIPEKILRRKLCWRDEREFADLETKIKKFYNDKLIEKKPTKEYPQYWNNYFDDFDNYLTIAHKIYRINYLERDTYRDYYIEYLKTQKYKMKCRFRLEVLRKLQEHLKTLQGHDIIRYC